MKTRKFIFKSVLFATAMFVGGTFLNSCKDDDPVVIPVTDVVNTEQAVQLTSVLSAAPTVADLPASFVADADVMATLVPEASTEKFGSVSLKADIDAMKARLVITSDEVTKLKANDLYTFNDVINRMSQMPSFTSDAEMDAELAIMEGNAELSPELMDVSDEDLSYEESYYQGVLDLQKFMTENTLAQMEESYRLSQTADIETKSTSASRKVKKLALANKRLLAQLRQLTKKYARLLQKLHNG